jgi:hypothetical protein
MHGNHVHQRVAGDRIMAVLHSITDMAFGQLAQPGQHDIEAA